MEVSIDGSHIPIAAPELNHTDYYNRKGWYLILVQAVVDHEYLSRRVGWAGSVHDARVFINSLLYKKITEEMVYWMMLKVLQVPMCLVGDSAYPMANESIF